MSAGPMDHMAPVETADRRIAEYEPIAGVGVVERLATEGAALRGLRVLHLNSTRNGGGVSEILRSLVPLLRDLGLDAEWRVIGGDAAFFEATKRIHNSLQGEPGHLSEEDRSAWLSWQQRNAAELADEFDVVVVHDPQPLGLASMRSSSRARWIWRLHVDTSTPEPSTWGFLREWVDPYGAVVVSMPQFAPADLAADRLRVIAPAIDPLLPKNAPMALGNAQRVVADLGIDLGRPVIAQVSRLDPWKDPIGVIRAFEQTRRHHAGVQLALLGAMEADDDPEAARIAAAVRHAANGDPDIHVFTDPSVIGPVQVGAVQLLASAVLQKSIREGFGLTVSEALWKSTPVIGGRAGGIVLQVQDETNGYLVDTPDDAADRCLRLLADPAEARAMGAAGRAFVREHYLITRLLADELALYRDVMDAPARTHRAFAGREA